MNGDRLQHLRIVEALIFAASGPISETDLSKVLSGDIDVHALLVELSEHYQERGVNLEKISNGWAFRTAPDLSWLLQHEATVQKRLSKAAVETLAIIAYHQPITRSEIEEIRGVGLSRGTLDLLLEATWIRPMGRRRTPGRPATYGTTDAFLNHFNLKSVDDLPGIQELKDSGLMDPDEALPLFPSPDSSDDTSEAPSSN